MQVRLSVEQDIMKKAKHAHYRESIAGRLGKPIGRLAIEDVRDALVRGEEVGIYTIYLSKYYVFRTSLFSLSFSFVLFLTPSSPSPLPHRK